MEDVMTNMTNRLDLAWEERSGPADIVGFIGAWPVARAYRDVRSSCWLWSATWLSGIGMRGSASGREEAVAAAEEAVAGWVGLSGLDEKVAESEDGHEHHQHDHE